MKISRYAICLLFTISTIAVAAEQNCFKQGAANFSYKTSENDAENGRSLLGELEEFESNGEEMYSESFVGLGYCWPMRLTTANTAANDFVINYVTRKEVLSFLYKVPGDRFSIQTLLPSDRPAAYLPGSCEGIKDAYRQLSRDFLAPGGGADLDNLHYQYSKSDKVYTISGPRKVVHSKIKRVAEKNGVLLTIENARTKLYCYFPVTEPARKESDPGLVNSAVIKSHSVRPKAHRKSDSGNPPSPLRVISGE